MTTDTMTTHNSSDTHNSDGGTEGPSYDDVNTPVIVLVGLISAIVTVVIIWGVQGMCYHWKKAYLNRAGEVVNYQGAEQIKEQKAAIESGEGIKPITIAMDEIVNEFGAKKN